MPTFVRTCTSTMDLLEIWPSDDTMTTQDIMKLSGCIHSVVYRWMMKLATTGYFDRDNRSQSRGGTQIYWTITPKGRAAALELRKIHA